MSETKNVQLSAVIEDLLRRVVARNFPKEVTAFSAAARDFIADAFAGRRVTFGTDVVTTLQFIILILATVKAVLDLFRLVRGTPLSLAAVQDMWRAKLVEHGLAEDEANSIVDEFSKDLMNAMKLTNVS